MKGAEYMRNRSNIRNIVVALIVIAAGAAVIWMGHKNLVESKTYYDTYGRYPSRDFGFMPYIIGGAIVLGGIAVIIDALVDSFSNANIERDPRYTTLLNGAFATKKKYREFTSAIRCHRHGDYDDAMVKLDALLAKCENGDEKSRVYTLMAMCYEDCENHNEAAKAYADAFAADGEKTYLLKRVVEQYKQAGQYLQAYLKLKDLVGKDSNNVKALIDAGEMCVVAERYSDAVEYGERAVELSENHSEAYMILCKAYRGLGDREKCQGNLNRYRVREGNTNALSYEEVWLSETEEVSE